MSVVHCGQGSNGARYSITVSCEDFDSNYVEESLVEYSESKESLSASYGSIGKKTRDLKVTSIPIEINKFCGKSPQILPKSLAKIKKGQNLSRSAVFPSKTELNPQKSRLKPRKNSCTASCCIF